jgi:hypothetical protein
MALLVGRYQCKLLIRQECLTPKRVVKQARPCTDLQNQNSMATDLMSFDAPCHENKKITTREGPVGAGIPWIALARQAC